MSDKFILEGHRAVPCDNLLEWGKWFEIANRHVAKTELPNSVTISTVFLGLNHSFGGRVPMLFETMIFGGKLDGQMERYPTWQDAEIGHRDWVKKVKEVEGYLVNKTGDSNV